MATYHGTNGTHTHIHTKDWTALHATQAPNTTSHRPCKPGARAQLRPRQCMLHKMQRCMPEAAAWTLYLLDGPMLQSMLKLQQASAQAAAAPALPPKQHIIHCVEVPSAWPLPTVHPVPYTRALRQRWWHACCAAAWPSGQHRQCSKRRQTCHQLSHVQARMQHELPQAPPCSGLLQHSSALQPSATACVRCPTLYKVHVLPPRACHKVDCISAVTKGCTCMVPSAARQGWLPPQYLEPIMIQTGAISQGMMWPWQARHLSSHPAA